MYKTCYVRPTTPARVSNTFAAMYNVCSYRYYRSCDVYIYIYIYRERESDTHKPLHIHICAHGKREGERERDVFVCTGFQL